ncbi:MAG: hypothetical protein LC785_16145 [Acidobacteria bacterium]|nr:hypothetical protein [Acidobacteriota bacterium]MCA1643435.1 hypothetical protein [Acidobacteriota bacterium]
MNYARVAKNMNIPAGNLASFKSRGIQAALYSLMTVILLLITMGLMQETVNGQEKVTYTIVNQSRWVIRNLYISSSSVSEWGSDRLGPSVLASTQNFTVSGIETGAYDIRMVDQDGDECRRMRVLVDKNTTWIINSEVLLACEQETRVGPTFGHGHSTTGKPASSLPPKPKIKVSTTPPKPPDTVLLNNGCNRVAGTPGGYDCSTAQGYSMCLSYKSNGTVKTCKASFDLAAVQKVSDDLFAVGCKRFLGRPDEFLCIVQRGFDACEVQRTLGKVKRCLKTKE